jgi:SAM-dependent methyltransferase
MIAGHRASLPAVFRLHSRRRFPQYGLATRQYGLRASAGKLSVHEHISTTNGNDWFERYQKVQSLIQPDVLRKYVTASDTDITGHAVYAKPEEGSEETRYDFVLDNWQSNYLYADCDTNGALVKMHEGNFTDELLMQSFYSHRYGRALDIGCNTGKNMMMVQQLRADQVECYGLEYSQDSVEIAAKNFGRDRVFWGDATSDFVSKHGWEGHFSLAHCTFVLQHMPPSGVDAALRNIARCLTKGGEFMTTFKDAPTADQLTKLGMEAWVAETFTADLADKEAYLRDGYIHAVIWDDDYYPGVASPSPPSERDLSAPGPHRREMYFYGLNWMKKHAAQYGLVAKEVGVVSDAKMPFSAFSWKVVFEKK